MSNKRVEDLLRKIAHIETKLAEVQTDAVWIKRIIIGAAGLGFLEKFIGWLR